MRPAPTATIPVIGLLLLHAALLSWIGFHNAPNVDEMAHLPAGVSHWRFATFELYRVNPPLVRMVAVMPVMAAGAKYDWRRVFDQTRGRREWRVGEDFMAANGPRVFRLFALARWACIPFSLVGGWCCYHWARLLFGVPSGYVALSLWCFSPIILANAAMITPDAAAASMGVVAAFWFWRWLRQPNWKRAVLSGLALGLVELTKTTWVVLFALWPALFLATKLIAPDRDKARRRASDLRQLCLMLLIALFMLNAGYGFQGSGRQLGTYRFESLTLGTPPVLVQGASQVRNRFAETVLAGIPVPLPSDYVLGIDVQRLNFEQGMWSYLHGEWRLGGWWYFYLYALAIKMPVGTWCLAGLAIGVTAVGRGYSASWRDEMILLAPFVVILVFVSSQTGFSIHSRYVIPALPFMFVWTSKVGRAFERRKVWAVGGGRSTYRRPLSCKRDTGVVALAVTVASSLVCSAGSC